MFLHNSFNFLQLKLSNLMEKINNTAFLMPNSITINT